MLFKSEKLAKPGELFYTRGGIGRKGVSLEGVKKDLDLIRHIAKSMKLRRNKKRLQIKSNNP